MPEAFGDLDGYGNQQVWIHINRHSQDYGQNLTTFYCEVRYYGNGYGSWSNSTQYWSATWGGYYTEGSFQIPQNEAFWTYKVLYSGYVSHYHDAAGYLPAFWCQANIATDHGAIGNGWAGTSEPEAPRIPKVPSKPPNMSFQSASTTTIDFLFYNSADNGGSAETGWDFQSATNAGFSQNLQTWVDYGSPGQATGLIPGTQHWIRYRSVNAVGFSVWSNSLVQTTLPATPPGMTVTAQPSGEKVDLVFTPPGGVSGVTKYTWERRVTGTTTPVATGDLPTAAGTLAGLTPGTRYDWRGSAWIGGYQSPWTNWQTVQQPKPNTNPGDYFDGASTDTPQSDYSWDGTANNSTSKATSPVPIAWEGYTTGGSLVLSQASPGWNRDRAARVTILADSTGAGQFGISGNFAAIVAGNATYYGSMYVKPSRSQRMYVQITWLTSGLGVISASAATPVIVPANVWTRLTVSGLAPSNAAKAVIWVFDAGSGTGWSTWKGGDTLDMDAAMLTLAEQYPYFDGASSDLFYDYAWEGTPDASESTRVPVSAESATDPLADPDCPPLPLPPRPPVVPADCIDVIGVWRRYWLSISDAEISDWMAVIPTITVTTGAEESRQVRVRIYENPDQIPASSFQSDTYISEQIISYLPPQTTITLDGVSERTWAAVNGGSPLAADRLIYGSGGAPATWPVLSCGLSYLLSFDAPLDASAGNLQIGLALTERAG